MEKVSNLTSLKLLIFQMSWRKKGGGGGGRMDERGGVNSPPNQISLPIQPTRDVINDKSNENKKLVRAQLTYTFSF
jgi:hypothetical protein